jgi:hypothetical protein
VRMSSAPQLRQAYTVSSTSAVTGRRVWNTILPAHAGQGIISEGKLDRGATV